MASPETGDYCSDHGHDYCGLHKWCDECGLWVHWTEFDEHGPELSMSS